MKKNWVRVLCVFILSCICVVSQLSPVFAQVNSLSTDTQNEEGTITDTFYVNDANNNIIHAFLKDGTYYLFLTDACDVNDLVIHSSAAVTTDAAGITADEAAMTLSGNFSASSSFEAVGSDGTVYKITLMQSTLPSLYINLNDGVSLDNIHADKDTNYGNVTTLTDSTGTNSINAKSATIKGRGNSSWALSEKKGYQLKFDKKQNVLGLGEAKKWVLLANSGDATMMMNKLAYDLSDNIGLDYATKGDYVDLWIEGEYRGTYLISTKVEIGNTRVDIGDDGVIAEMDNAFYQSETWFEDILGNHFALKDPDISDTGAQQNFNDFESLINDLEEYLPSSDWSEVTSRLDVESLAKMYLINEYMGNNEYTVTSQYWYMDGKIYAGPVWDFDSATYVQETSDQMYVYKGSIISQLLQREEFRSIVRSTYDQYRSQFVKMTSEIDTLAAKLDKSQAMNYTRWDKLGKNDEKNGYFYETYEQNVNRLKTWLTEREDSFWVTETGKSMYVDIEDDRDTVVLTYVDHSGNTGNISFAFWNTNNGQDDLKWYTASYAGSDTWKVTISLSDHETSGRFSFHVYDGTTLKSAMDCAVKSDVDAVSYDSMYRMYNPNSGEHFYTASLLEKKTLINAGWRFEGIGWKAPKSSSTPVYRLYNPNAGDHHYTVDISERDNLISLGWRYEGIGWYSDDAKTTPLYRQYNPNAVSGAHNYTTDVSERDHLISLGWRDEQIGWYGE